MPDVHAKFSPSASDRLIHCPPSLMLGEQYGPEDTGSEYSREGTEAHAVGEFLLKQALGLHCEDPRPSLTRRTISVRRASWIRIVRISWITQRFTAEFMDAPAFPSLPTTQNINNLRI